MHALCLRVYRIFCYESKVWLFALYGSSCCHSNKNGCFSCSKHGYFLLLRCKISVVSVVPVPSRDFLVWKYVLKTTHILATPAEARWIGWNIADVACQKICGRQSIFNVMTRLYKTFENIDRE